MASHRFFDCDDNDPDVNSNKLEIPYNGKDDDCNPATLDEDLDQDGFVLADDCDDNNANIHPDKTEEPYNGIDDDCNPTTLDDDVDQDGFLLVDDCDDNNAKVNPIQIEEPYNNIDDDCDSSTLDDDLDQDGFLLVDDCDDNNININPDAEEIPNNDIDENCDGMDFISSNHELGKHTIHIYPNPATDLLYVDVRGHLNFKITLYDFEGKLLTSSLNKSRISVSHIPKGIYILEIQDINSGQIIVEKVVVGD